MTRASFQIYADPQFIDEAVFVVDCDGPVSVTNDAEAVVRDVLQDFPGFRILYRDSEGRWDELKHDDQRFSSFAFLSDQDREHFASAFAAIEPND